jgi:DNA repair photolyase
VLTEFRNPFTIISKSHLVTRDIDLIAPAAERNQAAVFITITTLDASLTEKLEPRAARPEFRFKAVRELVSAGIPVGVMISPVIPGLTDHEIPAILAEAARAGAQFAGHIPLRLPGAVAPLFENWLAETFPERMKKVLGHTKQIRGGRLNDPRFGSRMRGTGAYARNIGDVFDVCTRRHGLNQNPLSLDTSEFRRMSAQMALF